MMNVLVTVGTTAFNSLFEALDKADIASEFNLLGQIADGAYRPKKFDYFEFDENFQERLQWADLVVTHAGAGTVYNLLEQGRKCIVVGNLERVDSHQTDIVRFLTENNFALATENVSDVPSLLEKAKSFTPSPYKKTDFFVAKELSEFVLNCYI